MSSPKNPMPKSYKEALEQLQKDNASVINRSMTYRLQGVQALSVAPRYRAQRIENPARRQSWWGWLTAEEYVWTTVRDLSELYIDGTSAGKLHGGSEDHAVALQPMVAAGPRDIEITGHFTESGWFIDSVVLVK